MTAVSQDVQATRERLQARPRPEHTVALATLGCGALLAWGWSLRDELYWSAERGLGYSLGIVGLVCLVALLGYSVRKRHRSLRSAGALAPWFRIHMLLGILGPTAILFHANFRLGSINSAVALISMLGVAGSGYAGRFVYSRIHRGLFGERRVLAELTRDAEEGFGAVDRVAEQVPELGAEFVGHERWALERNPSVSASWRRFVAVRRRGRALERRAVAALRRADRDPGRFLEAALAEHLEALARVAQFSAWERLFSLWHAIHLPLCVVLFAAAAVHVLAVHMF